MFERMDWSEVLSKYSGKWVKMKDVVRGIEGVILEGTVLDVKTDEEIELVDIETDMVEGCVWEYVPQPNTDDFDVMSSINVTF